MVEQAEKKSTGKEKVKEGRQKSSSKKLSLLKAKLKCTQV